ncbi:hypothetical protein J4E93_002585 [Alternaria ventricosa]|uniref:uncharacterized protein n=1 Tax=Alternaria ventricosa TaxID=1187951 RepID=UPI0020C44482|nr:uncharacterized protein J4E93_002585 [Alternaria ventricosa]KAI4652383.1 hypothetical protein J4E93_002585 [Alternaria ventricosa]
MPGTIVIEKIQGHGVSEEMLAQAAELFSSDYGIWGPLAEEKMGTFGNFCKAAFGDGIEKLNLSGIKDLVPAVMKSSPVPYVKMAKPTGSLFDQGDQTGAVCCADTAFWVDHAEPLAALDVIKEDGIKWPFGDLPDGCEFLAFVSR